ncbi:MAG TPA: ATP-grasp domain-containing protein [Streptosporangiaceae bacterium]|nr:ATP-grasp domain-containing protein [Streptosporangiaceae bacterium]
MLLMTAPARPAAAGRRQTVVCVAGRHVLDVMSAMGIRTILLDEEIPWDVTCAVDLPVEVDLTDWPACEHVLRRLLARTGLSVDAVVSLRDSHVPLAGFLAARLGAKGMSLSAALNCNDKARMRRALDGAGIANPRFALALEPKEAERLGEAVGFPLVLKRTRGAGGGAVRLCQGQQALIAAIADLTANTGPAELLAEQYLTGPEYAVQTVTLAGVTEILSVLRARIGPPPRFAETGYDCPAGLSPHQGAEIDNLVRAALSAVGLDHGVAHVQVRYTSDGPRIVEINPRPPGGVLAHVTHVVSGVDMVRAGVEAALGLSLTRSAPCASHVLYRCVVFDRPGYLSYEAGALSEQQGAGGDPLAPIVEVDASPGDLVLAVDHPDGGVYGRVVLFGDSDADLAAQYRAVMARLRLEIRQARPSPIPFRARQPAECDSP